MGDLLTLVVALAAVPDWLIAVYAMVAAFGLGFLWWAR
jgi:hypothetical protein